MCAKSLQLCSTLCDPMDYSPLGSSVHGVSPGRILEWVAMPSSSGSSQPRGQPRSPVLQMDSLPSEPPGKPVLVSGAQQSDSVIHIYVCTHVCA